VSASALFVMADGILGLDLWALGAGAHAAKFSAGVSVHSHQRRGVRVRCRKRRPTWARDIINLARNIGASVGIATGDDECWTGARSFINPRLMERVNDFSAAVSHMLTARKRN